VVKASPQLPSPVKHGRPLDQRIKRVVNRNRIWAATGYSPHFKQREVHDAITRGTRYLMIAAGTRGGKTRMLATELLAEMSLDPPENATHRLIQIAAPYAALTDKCFTWVWDAAVNNRILGMGALDRSKVMRYIEMPWHSRIVGNSMDNPDAALGDGVVFSACDEFARFKKGIFERYIERALMDHRGTVVCISTPTGFNHMHAKYEEWLERSKTDPLYFASRFTSYDNPYLPSGEVDRIRKRLERVGADTIFKQEYLAEFTALTGAVYPQFDRQRHVGAVEFREDCPVTLGVDWGFNNPACVLFAQVVGTCLHVFDEIYASGLTVKELAEQIIAKLAQYGVDARHRQQFDLAYCDPSGAGEREELIQMGIAAIGVTAARGRMLPIDEGILVVRSLLAREDEIGLLIDGNRCPNLIRELGAYHYAESPLQHDKPVKIDDHAPDALRYMCYGLFGGITDDWSF